MKHLLSRLQDRFFCRRSETIRAELAAEKFEQRAPAPQNAIDIFRGRWASDLSDVIAGVDSGPARHFGADLRPAFAFRHIAPDVAARGARILELGPLEGGHTYQFEQLGAGEIIAVEANVEAYLKCLIVKELAGLERAKFLLGDLVEYLRQDKTRYDLIFCCGVLYHIADPVELIGLMAAHSDLISIWSHYHTANSRPAALPESVTRDGETYTYFRLPNVGQRQGRYWGGNKQTASFLSRDDLFRACRRYGYVNEDIHAEEFDNPGGPCINVTFWR